MGKTTIPGSNDIYATKPAGADLTDKEGLNIKVSNGTVVLCSTAGEIPDGILVAGGKQNENVTYQIKGQTKMVASVNSIKAGNLLSTTNAGKGKAAAAAEFMFARALEDANSDGHRILVDIVNAGFKPAG